ncbi:MAG: 50S ribosomal protein L22 [Spirochaetaceae bacterium]|jgi:large subunit ribosomal protein L22|nr:50S ribosomal protein L22 [Spirochaetaceae bacterium]
MSKSDEKKRNYSGYRSITKFIIASPYKVRPVANLIRRRPYTEVLSVLENMPHKGAQLLWKAVKSAGSNALSFNKKLAEDMLYVKEVMVDDGPRMKRLWCRGRGRADMLLKRLCHITVIVDETVKAGI